MKVKVKNRNNLQDLGLYEIIEISAARDTQNRNSFYWFLVSI